MITVIRCYNLAQYMLKYQSLNDFEVLHSKNAMSKKVLYRPRPKYYQCLTENKQA